MSDTPKMKPCFCPGCGSCMTVVREGTARQSAIVECPMCGWKYEGSNAQDALVRADAIDTEALARLLVNDLLIHALIPSAYEPGVLVNFKRILDAALEGGERAEEGKATDEPTQVPATPDQVPAGDGWSAVVIKDPRALVREIRREVVGALVDLAHSGGIRHYLFPSEMLKWLAEQEATK